MSISFKPKTVSKKLLKNLHERSFDVISKRFGLHDDVQKSTLEAIGKKYNITRERVRQIEGAAIAAIRKSDEYKEHKHVFDELRSVIHKLGAVISEDELLGCISDDPSEKNHITLFLVVGENFKRHKENDHYNAHWSVDDDITENVHKSLDELYLSLDDNELITEGEIIKKFLDRLGDIDSEHEKDDITKRWLNLSKRIDKNPLGAWGKAGSSNVKTRGIRDYAYLMMREHGSPMHFREVAEAIEQTFGKKTHIATCHNELIKDDRFVLVGRGIYALKEWGYTPGVVRDVIREVIKKEGPLTKDDIIDRVLKERYLKKNTIVVNLQNSKYFKKNKDGAYTLA